MTPHEWAWTIINAAPLTAQQKIAQYELWAREYEQMQELMEERSVQ